MNTAPDSWVLAGVGRRERHRGRDVPSVEGEAALAQEPSIFDPTARADASYADCKDAVALAIARMTVGV